MSFLDWTENEVRINRLDMRCEVIPENAYTMKITRSYSNVDLRLGEKIK